MGNMMMMMMMVSCVQALVLDSWCSSTFLGAWSFALDGLAACMHNLWMWLAVLDYLC
jgi:hypothetical protein